MSDFDICLKSLSYNCIQETEDAIGCIRWEYNEDDLRACYEIKANEERTENLRANIAEKLWSDHQVKIFSEISSLIGCKDSDINKLDSCWQSKFFPQGFDKEDSKKITKGILEDNSEKLKDLIEELGFCKPTKINFIPEHFVIFGATSVAMQKRAEDLVEYLKNNNLLNMGYKISILTGYREVYKNGKISLISDGSEKSLGNIAMKYNKNKDDLKEFDLGKNVADHLQKVTGREIDVIDTPKPQNEDRANTKSTLDSYFERNIHYGPIKTLFISHSIYAPVQALKLLKLLEYYPVFKGNMEVYGSGCDVKNTLFLIMPELAKIIHITAERQIDKKNEL